RRFGNVGRPLLLGTLASSFESGSSAAFSSFWYSCTDMVGVGVPRVPAGFGSESGPGSPPQAAARTSRAMAGDRAGRLHAGPIAITSLAGTPAASAGDGAIQAVEGASSHPNRRDGRNPPAAP